MNYTDILSLVGGLCLFLFGMQVMGTSLEKCAGSRLRGLIGTLTTNRLTGFLTGLGVTAVIQSSSASTVMVVGFVNSGIMTLRQAINVIMGANVGTTVTAWLISMTGISGESFIVQMLKPTNFTPVLALIGIYLSMMAKTDRKKEIGSILLGFATLMFGMDTMSAAVAGLKAVPEFGEILLIFSNPILGVLAGAVLTAIIQSSSASVGILQALSASGQVTIGTSIPIILGQNIGTCVTALLSSIGTGKNARRAALVHLSFNVIGCVFWLTAFTVANAVFDFGFVMLKADTFTIAVTHTVFNVACTACMLPLAGMLEKLAMRLIPEGDASERDVPVLDELLLATPSFAVDRCRAVSFEMAECARQGLFASLDSLGELHGEVAERVRELEDKTDRYEDVLGSYLVKLSAKPLTSADSNEVSKILHMIGNFERISDHSVNLIESAEEMRAKGYVFSAHAADELRVLVDAVREIVDRSFTAYITDDEALARRVEPLEQVVDVLKDQLRARHIHRLQAGECTLGVGFVLSDLLTNLERIADHCSNIAACVVEMKHSDLDLHGYLDDPFISSPEFASERQLMTEKYLLP